MAAQALVEEAGDQVDELEFTVDGDTHTVANLPTMEASREGMVDLLGQFTKRKISDHLNTDI